MKRMKMFLTCWPVMMLLSLAAVLHSCNEDDSIVANSHYDADIFPDLSYDEMIYVEGGTFTMGAASEQTDAWDREEPAHQVTLSSYYIGKYEVTQALWKAVMGENPSSHKGDNLPVESVSWNDCQDFIRELNALTGKNFRLPTEAEWEYAARGGNSSKGCKYSGGNEPDKVAWYDDNALYETHEAGLKSPNELGIYDMSGNGAAIGMEITTEANSRILPVLPPEPSVYCEGAVGAPIRVRAGCPIAITLSRLCLPTISVCALYWRRRNRNFTAASRTGSVRVLSGT